MGCDVIAVFARLWTLGALEESFRVLPVNVTRKLAVLTSDKITQTTVQTGRARVRAKNVQVHLAPKNKKHS